MVRHEYADHVAALVAAAMSGAAVSHGREVDIDQLARDAAQIGDAIAALRYPETPAPTPAPAYKVAP